MSTRVPVIACVGHAALDLVYAIDAFPAGPTKVRANSFAMGGGGMAANAACAIGRLGGHALFLGPVGDDEFGDRVVAELADAGVDLRHLQRVPGAGTSHSAIVVDAKGERLIVGLRGTALEAAPAAIPFVAGAVDAVLADVRWPAGAAQALDWARGEGIPAVLDGEVGERPDLAWLVTKATHIIFSEPGFAQWAGMPIDIPGARDCLDAPVAAGAALAAVTMGERGGLYRTAGERGRFAAFPVDAVETLGAGDVFHGAFALAIAQGATIADALRFASAAAALRCARRGGRTATPTRAEVDALLLRRTD